MRIRRAKMADQYSVLILVIIVTGCFAADHVKGYYCQDPDNGNLYPLNATWRSSSFCGNYTCKIRKLNETETQYKPLVVNITRPNLITNNDKVEVNKERNLNENQETAASNVEEMVLIDRKAPEVVPLLQHFIHKYNNTDNQIDDRYLSNAEIASLAKMLHSVKKSDLDALMEIYNLAQDIFKEIDKKTDEELVDDTYNTIDLTGKGGLKQKAAKAMVSYFYSPLHKTPSDMDNAGSNTVNVQQPYAAYNPTPSITSRTDGAQYYYPTSNFQRPYSYVNPRPTPIYPQYIPSTPCARKQEYLTPWFYNQIQKHRMANPPQYSQGTILLPYPYTAISKSESPYPGFYQVGEPNEAKTNFVGPVTSENKNITTEEINTKVVEDKNDIFLNENKETTEKPAWKTEPLSSTVLDEIRAKILDKTFLQPIALRKKVKLERVGKILKINDMKRPKREAQDLFETFLEKTTCESDQEMEPGFFKMGDNAQSYPECCPKRIALDILVNDRSTEKLLSPTQSLS